MNWGITKLGLSLIEKISDSNRHVSLNPIRHHYDVMRLLRARHEQANLGPRVVAGPDVLRRSLNVLASSLLNLRHRHNVFVTAAACNEVTCATMISSKPLLARLLNESSLLQYIVHWILRRSMALRRLLSFGGPPGPSDMQPHYRGQKEQNVLDMVLRTTPPGNPEAVLDAIDKFGWNSEFLMNIGDRKGAILDKALQKRQPQVALELGGYIGYSAVRIASQLPPGGKLYSIDPNESHVRIARALIQHAGLSDKVEVIQGILETSIQVLHLQGVHTIDFALIDHVKHLYLKDLLVLQKNGFLKKGSVVVGDNVLTPGSPDFRKHMQSDEYATVEHLTNLEYSNYMLDIVTVSEYRGREGPQ